MKFCSRKCKFREQNFKAQHYDAQQKRGTERRLLLLQLKGGCCEICGYRKNTAALSFHHLIPADKSFAIDLRRCSNGSWQKLLQEVAKCQLLCMNCHTELHNPGFST